MRLPESTAHVQPGTPSDGKPHALPVLFDHIPAELQALDQWVLWRYEWKPPERKQKGKWDKVPYTASGWKADSTRPETWATFGQVKAAYEAHGRGQLGGSDDAGGWDGIGFVPLPENNLTVVDLDKCRDKDTGDVEPWAAAVVGKMDTYAEASPSGTGLRVVAFGHKPDHERSKKGPVEVYDGLTKEGKSGGRYLTFTGHRLDRCPATVNERQPQVEALYHETFGKPRTPPAAPRAGANGAADPAAVFRAEAGITEEEALPTEARAQLDKLVRECGSAPDRSKADYNLCCWAIRQGIGKEVVWARLQHIGKTGERGWKYFSDTWDNAEADVEHSGTSAPVADGTGTTRFPSSPPPALPPHTLGGVTLRPENPRRTCSKVSVAVVVTDAAGETVGRLSFSDSVNGQKEAAKALRKFEPNADPSPVVCKILAEASAAAAAADRQRSAGKRGPTIASILEAKVPGCFDLAFRCTRGAYSNKRGEEVTAADFVRFTPPWLRRECLKATDCPRYDNGEVNRLLLLKFIKAELEGLWAGIVEKLPTEEGANVGPTSPAAKRFKRVLVEALTDPIQFEVEKTAVGTGGTGQVYAARTSLIERIRDQAAEYTSGPKQPTKREPWRRVQKAFDAWWKVVTTKSGEVVVLVGLRWRIGFQAKKNLPGVHDQKSFRAQCRKSGLSVRLNKVRARLTDGTRLVILSGRFARELLALPV
jgi:hypothetical protein